MNNIHNAFKRERNLLNISQAKLAKELGVTQSQIAKIETGKSAVTMEIVDKMVKLGANFSDIIGGGEDELTLKSERSNITPVEEGHYMMVEYADLRASAGVLGGSDVTQLPETHRRLVPREFDNGNFLIVRVDGDSMDDGTKRSLSDGDEVLIKEKLDYKIDELPIKKALFVITTREGNVLKQIAEVNMDEGYILCRSFNPDPRFDDFKIYFDNIFQIFIVCKKTQSQISF